MVSCQDRFLLAWKLFPSFGSVNQIRNDCFTNRIASPMESSTQSGRLVLINVDGIHMKRGSILSEPLIADLTSPDRFVRSSAVWSFVENGGDVRALPGLKLLLDDDNEPFIKLGAAAAIARMAPNDTLVMPILLEGLQHPNEFHRSTACEIIGDLNDTSVIPCIIPLLNDEETSIRFEAGKTIGKLIGDWSHAIAECVIQLKDEDEIVRIMGRENLSILGPHANETIPLIRQEMETINSTIRVELENVLDDLERHFD